MGDSRVFFAAERTLLAWIRTGLGLMGFGFAVSRTGLVLRLWLRSLPDDSIHRELPGFSSTLGVTLVGIGAISVISAAMQFQSYVRTLLPMELPSQYRRSRAVFLAYLIAMVGSVMAFYLTR